MSEGHRLRVHIATTNGPVEIQRITEEDPEIDSVVCLAGKAMPLPISGGYHNFVRQPSGIVQRLFGHSSYRVDLSATIEDGYSWQLGLLIGHAAKAAGRFAGNPGSALDGPIHAVFATGEVNVDHDVLPVGHVAVKIDRLTPMARELMRAGAEVTIVVPAANRGDVDEARYGAAGFDPERCRITYAATVEEALSSLGIAIAGRRSHSAAAAASAAGKTRSRPSGFRLRTVVAIAIAATGFGGWAAGAAAFADWRDLAQEGRLENLDKVLAEARDAGGISRLKAELYEAWLDHSRPADGAVDLRVIEYRAPEGKTCAAVRFGAAEAKQQTPERATARSFAPARFDGLCALEFVADADSDGIYLWGRYERRLAGPDAGGAAADMVELGPERRVLRWRIDLPRRLGRAFDMRIVVAAARRPIDGASGWLAGHIPPPGPPENAQAWYSRVTKLNARGITLLDAAYGLSP